MPKNLRVSIPEPCHQDWQQMTPAEKGRHCSSCNKVVVDFTRMSDQQVVAYFENYKQKTCGRFRTDQLNKDIPVTASQRLFKPVKYLAASLIAAEILGNHAQANDTADRSTLPPIVQTDSSMETGITNEIITEDTTATVDTAATIFEHEFISGDVDVETPLPIILQVSGNVTYRNGACAIAPVVEYEIMGNFSLPIEQAATKAWPLLPTVKNFLALSTRVFHGEKKSAGIHPPENGSSKTPPKRSWYSTIWAVLVNRLRITKENGSNQNM